MRFGYRKGRFNSMEMKKLYFLYFIVIAELLAVCCQHHLHHIETRKTDCICHDTELQI